jgi:hypothetical protein
MDELELRSRDLQLLTLHSLSLLSESTSALDIILSGSTTNDSNEMT